MGKCLSCGSFNTVEAVSSATRAVKTEIRARRLSDIEIEEEGRVESTGVNFLDRILGGGLPRGSVVLVAGEPGIGKSTLLFQMLSQRKQKALYISAEESLSQIGRRYKSFGHNINEEMYLLAESRVAEILLQMQAIRPVVMVIDSIQMLSTEDERVKGGMASIRDVTDVLVEKAKSLGVTLFIVGHVNKDGEIAGPKTLEHMVDTVVTFTMAEDGKRRVLQTQKHRFGASGEVSLLDMTDKGLSESQDFDSFWVQKHQKQVYGCAVASVLMGTRVVNVEIQALVVNSFFPSPRRSTSGFDFNRLLLILAVLEKRLKIPFSRYDVYLNVVGGVKIADPGADLAVAAALVSAHSETPLEADAVYIGEIGLTGELRPPRSFDDRVRAFSQRGRSKIIAPVSSGQKTSGVDTIEAVFKGMS